MLLMASCWSYRSFVTNFPEKGLTSLDSTVLKQVHALRLLESALTAECKPPAVVLLSLQAQLQAGATNIKPVQMLQYGADGPVDTTRCTAVCFIPGSEGTVFAAAHISGTVIIHIKVALLKHTCSRASPEDLTSPPTTLHQLDELSTMLIKIGLSPKPLALSAHFLIKPLDQ